jgi:hypothetical protein
MCNMHKRREHYDYTTPSESPLSSDRPSSSVPIFPGRDGHVLMPATAYQSARDHQWAAQHDLLFATCKADVEISVSGLAQANQRYPVASLCVLLGQVLDAVAGLPHPRLRDLDKQTWGEHCSTSATHGSL